MMFQAREEKIPFVFFLYVNLSDGKEEENRLGNEMFTVVRRKRESRAWDVEKFRRCVRSQSS